MVLAGLPLLYFAGTAIIAADTDNTPVDTECELMMLGQTDDLTTTCCTSPSSCNSDAGIPTACTLECGQKWIPFANHCSDFLASNFDFLDTFTENCYAACAGHDCDGPAPEPAQISFISFDVSFVAAYTSDGEVAFRDGLRFDIATALNINQEDVIIAGLSPQGAGIDIFQVSYESCQSISDALVSQWSQDTSSISTGRYSSAIIRQQPVDITIETVKTSQNSDPKSAECFSMMHHTASFSNPMWQAGGVSG